MSHTPTLAEQHKKSGRKHDKTTPEQVHSHVTARDAHASGTRTRSAHTATVSRLGCALGVVWVGCKCTAGYTQFRFYTCQCYHLFLIFKCTHSVGDSTQLSQRGPGAHVTCATHQEIDSPKLACIHSTALIVPVRACAKACHWQSAAARATAPIRPTPQGQRHAVLRHHLLVPAHHRGRVMKPCPDIPCPAG